MEDTTNSKPNPGTPKFRKWIPEATIEKVGTGFDSLQSWLTQAWRIGLLMGKGAYLLTERKRLFSQLGEEVYYKISKGELAHTDLDAIVKQLDRLTKKVELEEIRIRSIRFGKQAEEDLEQE